MGTGHYYFDAMRSSFNLVQNQLLCAQKNQYLQNKLSKSQQPQQQGRKREHEIKKSMKLRFVKTLLNMHFLKMFKKLKA
jgi:hypothetical protein